MGVGKVGVEKEAEERNGSGELSGRYTDARNLSDRRGWN